MMSTTDNNQAEQFGLDVSCVWQALADDTMLPVLIVDSQGSVEYANAAAASSGGVAAGMGLAGATAGTQLRWIGAALSENRAVTFDDRHEGRAARTTVRPLPAKGQARRRVLLVTRPMDGLPVGAGAGSRSEVLSGLTPRELEILRHIGAGLSTAQIAKELGRSVKTVEWHRVSLGEKLGASNRVELARIAIATGLVSVTSRDSNPRPRAG